MSGNRSLDEFADAGSGTDEQADGPAAAADASPDDAAMDPPASTYVWHPEGAQCDDCGTAVEERWRDGDELVCVGCKEW